MSRIHSTSDEDDAFSNASGPAAGTGILENAANMTNMLGNIGVNFDMQNIAKSVVKSATNPHELGLTGYFNDVKHNMDTNGKDADPRITGTQFT